jgi:hypothetical protein
MSRRVGDAIRETLFFVHASFIFFVLSAIVGLAVFVVLAVATLAIGIYLPLPTSALALLIVLLGTPIIASRMQEIWKRPWDRRAHEQDTQTEKRPGKFASGMVQFARDLLAWSRSVSRDGTAVNGEPVRPLTGKGLDDYDQRLLDWVASYPSVGQLVTAYLSEEKDTPDSLPRLRRGIEGRGVNSVFSEVVACSVALYRAAKRGDTLAVATMQQATEASLNVYSAFITQISVAHEFQGL